VCFEKQLKIVDIVPFELAKLFKFLISILAFFGISEKLIHAAQTMSRDTTLL